MSQKRYSTAHDILCVLQELEEEESTMLSQSTSINVFITPPNEDIETDADSGDDEGGTINNLNSHQLSAEAELVLEGSQDEVLRISAEDNSEVTLEQEEELPSTSPKRKKSKNKHSKEKNKKQNAWMTGDLPASNLSHFLSSHQDFFLPNHVQRLLSPLEIFQFFFCDEFLEEIAKQSEIYAIQKGNTNFQLPLDDLKVFLGVIILSGYVDLPRRRMYWEESADVNNSAVSSAMRRNRFEEIMRYLHLNNNLDTNINKEDKLWKLKPYLDHLNKTFYEYAVWEMESSVDEAMIPYYGRHGLKQCIKGKPIRFGYKAWCHNFKLGYLIQFMIYQGAKGQTNMYKETFGLGGSVLLHFADQLPKNSDGTIMPHKLFADNFFISLKVSREFSRRLTGLTGTIRKDRTENCPLQDVSKMKKTPRGTFESVFETNDYQLLCRWNDNSVVTVLSNIHTVAPLRFTTRYSASEKKKIQVQQPFLIKEYNTNMGGTDRMDQNVATYRSGIRSKKWWWPIFLWGLDVAIQNAWLLHRQTLAQNMDLLDFRRSIAKELLQRYGNAPRRSGFVRSSVQSRVSQGTKFDGVGHYIGNKDKRTRCAFCKSTTSKMCVKCGIALHEKCFVPFHDAK